MTPKTRKPHTSAEEYSVALNPALAKPAPAPAPQHTPKPWYYAGYADHEGEARRPYHGIYAADGSEVTNQNGILEEPDARLIAAAPELLEALSKMILVAMGGGISIEIRDAAIAEARAALAKAGA